MSFSISIGGHVDNDENAEGVEQELIDDIVAVLTKHNDHINYGNGSFQYAGTVDLAAAANAIATNPPDDGTGDTPPPDTGTGTGDTGTPDPGTTDPAPSGDGTPVPDTGDTSTEEPLGETPTIG